MILDYHDHREVGGQKGIQITENWRFKEIYWIF